MKQIRKRKQSTKTSSGPIGTIFPLSLDVQRTKGISRWGGGGEVSHALSRKLEKNSLIGVIYGLNFSFKKRFLRVFGRKIGDFSLRTFLFRVVDNCSSRCSNSKKTPLP